MRSLLKMINNDVSILNNKIEKIKFLSGSTLKIIAIITMFIDHFSKIVLPVFNEKILYPMVQVGTISAEQWNSINHFITNTLYGIGSMAFPLFCCLLVEGFHHTRNRKKYFLQMLGFAIISEIPFDIGFYSKASIINGTYPFYFGHQNVFFTLLLGLCSLWCIEKFRYLATENSNNKEKYKSIFLQYTSVAIITLVAYIIRCDYSIFGILLITGFYISRNNRVYKVTICIFIYILMTGKLPTIYLLLSCVAIALYNGEKGKIKLKYFFYIFYPAHISILSMIRLWIVT